MSKNLCFEIVSNLIYFLELDANNWVGIYFFFEIADLATDKVELSIACLGADADADE